MEELRNEEMMDVIEEGIEIESGNGWKVASGVGLAVLASVLVGKYVVKPLVAKIKAKKEEKEAEVTMVNQDAFEPDPNK